MKKILIIGAGEAGKMVAREIIRHSVIASKYELVGFLDDNQNIKTAEGFPVLGTVSNVDSVIFENEIDEVIIAVPSADREAINRIIAEIPPGRVRTRIVPGIYEIIQGDVSFAQIRDFEPEDLLGREEVGFDKDKLTPFYKGRTVFITGAGGSIGSEIMAQLMELPVKKAVAFGHGENSIHQLIMKYQNDPRFEFIIGDIRDFTKLKREMIQCQPDIVFHAAAHKHVPIMEKFPDEAIKTNVIGTYNVAKSAIESGVKHFVFVSTDKAVKPTSVMGATKRIAERLILSLNKQVDSVRFLYTRFGNVLNSNGSVIPIFVNQIKTGGPVTVTHPDMIRYYMSIREAARLVIKACTVSDGNMFVLDMGEPVKIVDLAKQLIRLYGYSESEIPIIFSGIRPGEKLIEEVLTEQEQLLSTEYEKLLISEGEDDGLTLSQIEGMIAEFKKYDEINDIVSMINLIKKYAPEYKGENDE